MMEEIIRANQNLRRRNRRSRKRRSKESARSSGVLQKVLVANRGEIAKRFFQALHEEGIPSVAVVTRPDAGQSWYEFADEVVYIGDANNYAHVPTIIAAAFVSGANAIYPGYGFLSENAEFVEGINEASAHFGKELIFMGPAATVMRKVGNKLDARNLAKNNSVPVFEGSEEIRDVEHALAEAGRIGYPVLVKLNAGGGGKGMEPVFEAGGMAAAVESSRRIGKDLYKDDSFYLEKLIQKPVHIEVQIFNGLAVGIRKCAAQRRNQKIIEENGQAFLEIDVREKLFAAAENMARISGYGEGGGAGTVEFLYDADSGEFGFLEMNTRLQVEYAVTDQSMEVDLVKWQIRFFDGRADQIPFDQTRAGRMNAPRHAIECRIYAEDPENDYLPSPGKILKIDLPTFNGVRCDFGFREGDRVLPAYDPMIGKIIVYGEDRPEALSRLERALQEIYVKGPITNIAQLLRIVRSPAFLDAGYTNRLLADNPELESGDANLEGAAADRRRIAAVLFGAFTAHIHQLRVRAREWESGANAPGLLSDPVVEELPHIYDVDYAGASFRVKFIQRSMANFYVYIDDVYNGQIGLARMSGQEDEFVVRFGSRSLHIRADRKPAFTIIRVKDRRGKVQYHRLRVQAQGVGESENLLETIRAPFQGTFVKLAEADGAMLKVGDRVERGAPLIVVSAMKMETTVYAEVDGQLSYLIENGDLSRLQLGTTTDGRILGKSIAEGEVLAMIDPDSALEAEAAERPGGHAETSGPGRAASGESEAAPAGRTLSLLEGFFERDLETLFVANPQRNLMRVVKIIESVLKGYIPHSALGENFGEIVKQISADECEYKVNPVFAKRALAVLRNYIRIKRVFSPVLASDVSYFAELNLYMNRSGQGRYRPSQTFQNEIDPLFAYYGFNPDDPDTDEVGAMRGHMYMYMFQSRMACTERRELVQCLVHLLARACEKKIEAELRESIRDCLEELWQQELTNLDESLAEYVREVLHNIPPDPALVSPVAEPAGRSMTALDTAHPLLVFEDRDVLELHDNIAQSLEGILSDSALIPDAVSPAFRHHLTEKLARSASDGSVLKRLYSPLDDVLIYLCEAAEAGQAPRLVVLAHVEADDSNSTADCARSIWTAVVRSLQVLFAVRFVGKNPPFEIPREGHSVEVYFDGALDLSDPHPERVNYWVLARELDERFSFLQITNFESVLLHVGARENGGGSDSPRARARSIKMRGDGESLQLEYVDHLRNGSEPESQTAEALDPATSRLLARGKWPVSFWLEEMMDAGSVTEIRLPSIDEKEYVDPKTGKRGFQPVGARLYYGRIDDQAAVFFMKDSRVRGGATGNLEGLKYVAAGYLAYMQNVPLYVWNDGAGANIKEGVISLNRAAQGFMFNTLLAENVDAASFRAYVDNNFDPALKTIIAEVQATGLIRDDAANPRQPLFTVAVGIGSSAGLDVYGSSQATLQVLLDSPESYRVLTGSNVIRSVTGEDFTNYEIGGARIMGKWTGIADCIARDKIHLLAIVRRLHGLFAVSQKAPASLAAESSRPGDTKDRTLSAHTVLNERLIRAVVDQEDFWPFKQEYFAAGSILGGFARLGGHRVLVLGARSHFGVRSTAAVIRSRELLRTGARTQTPRILVFGRRWFQPPASDESAGIRARMDFLNTLRDPRAPQINIVTHIEGLQLIEMNCTADAVIYVQKNEADRREQEVIRQSAAFVVNSVAEAFEIARKAIAIFAGPGEAGPQVFESVSPPPAIPSELNQPFDIVAGVIERAFDPDSFLEFHQAMNDPITGPALVTGFARLNGRVVGILADQPAIMGGAPDAPGTEKFRFFTELLNKHRIPLVMLSNAPGFVPGTRQERLRIQAIGAESLDANVLGRIPVVSVVLNQNYGGRQIHAFSKFLRPGIVYIALDRALIAVMGGQAAYDLFQGATHRELMSTGQEAEAAANHRKFLEDFNRKSSATGDATTSGVLDWSMRDVAELREHLIRGLGEASKRCADAFE